MTVKPPTGDATTWTQADIIRWLESPRDTGIVFYNEYFGWNDSEYNTAANLTIQSLAQAGIFYDETLRPRLPNPGEQRNDAEVRMLNSNGDLFTPAWRKKKQAQPSWWHPHFERSGRSEEQNSNLNWMTVTQALIGNVWAVYRRKMNRERAKGINNAAANPVAKGHRRPAKHSRQPSNASHDGRSDSDMSVTQVVKSMRMSDKGSRSSTIRFNDSESDVEMVDARFQFNAPPPKPAITELTIFAIFVRRDSERGYLILETVPVSYSTCMTAAYLDRPAGLDFTRFSAAAAPGTAARLDAKEKIYYFIGDTEWQISLPRNDDEGAGYKLGGAIQHLWTYMDTRQSPSGVEIFHTLDGDLIKLLPREYRG